MNSYCKKILTAAIIIVLSAILFGCAKDAVQISVNKDNEYAVEIESSAGNETDAQDEPPKKHNDAKSESTKSYEQVISVTETDGNDSFDADSFDAKESEQSVQDEKNFEDKDDSEKNTGYFCALTVRCDELLSNLDKLSRSKYNLIPKDGIIFSSERAKFSQGESVFDVLCREMKDNNIHMEFEYTPGFGSYYVKGIGNLYESDCGNMSGWIYKINGKIPSVGCSQYILNHGDVVEWTYMCG